MIRAPFSGPGNQYVMAATAYRDGFVAVGEDFQSDAKVDGAIWTSANGGDWSRLDSADNGLTGAEVDYVATRSDRLVVVGQARTGALGPGSLEQLVWTSNDGSTWQRLDVPSPFGDAAVVGITAGPLSFVAWGLDRGAAVMFRSTDGTEWAKTTDDRAFANMTVAAVKAYRGGFVAIGSHHTGNGATVAGGREPATNAAWCAPDGVAWQNATMDEEGFGLQSLDVGASGLTALGGGRCGGCVGPATMWRSPDGLHWSHVGDDVPNGPAYVSDGARVVRYDWQGNGDVFESFDGIAWARIGTTGPLSVYNVALGRHGMLLVDSISPGGAGPGDENDGAVRFLAAH